MNRYKNFSGASNVDAYEIEVDSIKVKFKDGVIYVYTIQSVGAHNLARMKQLAVAGQGLNGFINRFVRKAYASKYR